MTEGDKLVRRGGRNNTLPPGGTGPAKGRLASCIPRNAHNSMDSRRALRRMLALPVALTVLPAFLVGRAARAALVLTGLTDENCATLVQQGVMRREADSYNIEEPEAVRLALRRVYPEANDLSSPAADQVGTTIRSLVWAVPVAAASPEERTRLDSLIDEMVTCSVALKRPPPRIKREPPASRAELLEVRCKDGGLCGSSAVVFRAMGRMYGLCGRTVLSASWCSAIGPVRNAG